MEDFWYLQSLQRVFFWVCFWNSYINQYNGLSNCLREVWSKLVELISFANVAEFAFRRMLTRKVVYLITDQYKPGSTKSLECERSKDLMVQCDFGLKKGSRSNWSNGRNTWKMINKSELVKFLLEDWSNPNVLCPLIYSCHYFAFQLWLTIIQIETNGWCCWMCIWRMIQVLLSTKHAKALGASTAFISTVDSNIAIHALYFPLQISIPMYIVNGTCDRQRCINVQKIGSEIEEDICSAFHTLHLLTVNTSAF